MVVFGRFSWMSEIWVVILTSLIVLELVLFSIELVRLLLELLRLVHYLWVFRLSWVWFVVSTFLLASTLLRLLMYPPLLSVLSGLPLFGAVWSTKMPLANSPAILNFLDGPVDVDPAFHVIWSRFRMMRRFLAYCLEEEPRIFRMLDLVSRGAQGHGPVLGFAWDGNEHGWVRVSLPPLRMMTGPIQHFRSAILEAWHFHVLLNFLNVKVFGVLNLLILRALYNYLPRPT